MKDIEYGIFMPVGSGGWIPSGNIPLLDGSYSYNRRVAELSESLGFDFTLSQAVWRGYGGTSKHFDVNLESLITSAGLAEVTEDIGVWSTVNTAMIHPAIAAKMVATQSQISNGRTGLNIVAGGNRRSETQMGLGRDLDNSTKYRRRPSGSKWSKRCGRRRRSTTTASTSSCRTVSPIPSPSAASRR